MCLIQQAGFVKMEGNSQALRKAERFEGWASEEPDVAGAGSLVVDCG